MKKIQKILLAGSVVLVAIMLTYVFHALTTKNAREAVGLTDLYWDNMLWSLCTESDSNQFQKKIEHGNPDPTLEDPPIEIGGIQFPDAQNAYQHLQTKKVSYNTIDGLYIVGSDGVNPRKLPLPPGMSTVVNHGWTDSGDRIIFESNHGGLSMPRLYVYSLQSGMVSEVTNGIEDIITFKSYGIRRISLVNVSGYYIAYEVKDLRSSRHVIVLSTETGGHFGYTAWKVFSPKGDYIWPVMDLLVYKNGEFALHIQKVENLKLVTKEMRLYPKEDWDSWNDSADGYSIKKECEEVNNSGTRRVPHGTLQLLTLSYTSLLDRIL